MDVIKRTFRVFCEASSTRESDFEDQSLVDKATQFSNEEKENAKPNVDNDKTSEKKGFFWIGEKTNRPFEMNSSLINFKYVHVIRNYSGFPLAVMFYYLTKHLYGVYKLDRTMRYALVGHGCIVVPAACVMGVYGLVGKSPLDFDGDIRVELAQWKDTKINNFRKRFQRKESEKTWDEDLSDNSKTTRSKE